MSPYYVPLGPINAVAAIVETDARLIDLLDGLSLQDWEVPDASRRAGACATWPGTCSTRPLRRLRRRTR